MDFSPRGSCAPTNEIRKRSSVTALALQSPTRTVRRPVSEMHGAPKAQVKLTCETFAMSAGGGAGSRAKIERSRSTVPTTWRRGESSSCKAAATTVVTSSTTVSRIFSASAAGLKLAATGSLVL